MNSQFSTDADGRLRVTPVRYLFIAFLFISSFISGQGIEPTSLQPTPYKNGILKGVIPFVDEFTGDTMYIYQHADSLVFVKDSIFVRNDSIFLRDGTGFVILKDTSATNELPSIYASYLNVLPSTAGKKVGDYAFFTNYGGKMWYWYIFNGSTWVPINNSQLESLEIAVIESSDTSHTYDFSHRGEHSFIKMESDSNIIFEHYLNENEESVLKFKIADHIMQKDSIYKLNDTIRLRDGSGYIVVPPDSTAIISGPGIIVTENPANTFKVEADTSVLATVGDVVKKVGGTGVPTQVAFWGGADSLSSSGNLYWDNTNNRLGIGTSSPTEGLHTTGYVRAEGIRNPSSINLFHGTSWSDGTEIAIFNNQTNYVTFKPSGSIFNTYLGIGETMGSAQFPFRVKGLFSDISGIHIARFEKADATDVLLISTDGKVGVNGTGVFPSRNLDVNGEVRIRDLITDTPTGIIGADADGDLGAVTLGTGLTMSGGLLNGNTGTVTSIATTLPITGGTITSAGTIGINNASASATGALTSTDWNTFNNKQAALVSGTNIKTVNGNSLLGSGNVSVGTVTSVDINGGNGISTTAGPVTGSGIINVFNTKPFDYIGLQAGLDTIYQLGNGQTLNITAPAPFNLSRLNGSFNLSLPAADAATDGYLKYQDWAMFNGKVGGSGVATRVAFWDGSNSLSSNGNLFWDNTNKRLGIGTNAPQWALDISGSDIRVNGCEIGLGGGNVSTNNRFGVFSLENNTTGSYNMALGGYALRTNTTGSYNTAIGNGALQNNNNNYNTAIGSNALYSNTGSGNTGVGNFTLEYNSSGGYNTAIGLQALYTNSTGSGNIGIGYQAGFNETGSNTLYIANSPATSSGIYGDFANSRFGVNLAPTSLTNTFDINGTLRVRTTTGTATSLMGRDANGVMITVPMSGLSIVGGTLTNTSTRLNVGGVWYSGDLYLGTQNTGAYPSWSQSSGTINFNLPSGQAGQVLKHNGTNWSAGTDNSGSNYSYWSLQANSGSTYNVGSGFNVNFANTTGISWSQNGTGTISATVADQSSSNELQSLSYGFKSGTDIPLDIGSGTGVYMREGAGITLGRTASNVMTIQAADNSNSNEIQSLSFTSPNLTISGGNSVTLPVLPSGTTNQTLRHNGASWVASNMLKNSDTRVDINSWAGTVNLGSKLLVNGYIQYNPTGFQATTLAGRDSDGGLTDITVGSGLSLSGGTLTSTSGTVVSGQIANANIAQTVTQDVVTDMEGVFGENSGGMTGTTTTITIPSSGQYMIAYSLTANHSASAKNMLFRTTLNGSQMNRSIMYIQAPSASSTYGTPVTKTWIQTLTAGDTIKGQVYVDTGGGGGVLNKAVNNYSLSLFKL